MAACDVGQTRLAVGLVLSARPSSAAAARHSVAASENHVQVDLWLDEVALLLDLAVRLLAELVLGVVLLLPPDEVRDHHRQRRSAEDRENHRKNHVALLVVLDEGAWSRSQALLVLDFLLSEAAPDAEAVVLELEALILAGAANSNTLTVSNTVAVRADRVLAELVQPRLFAAFTVAKFCSNGAEREWDADWLIENC